MSVQGLDCEFSSGGAQFVQYLPLLGLWCNLLCSHCNAEIMHSTLGQAYCFLRSKCRGLSGFPQPEGDFTLHLTSL